MTAQRKKILFFCETVTLAHFVRPWTIAQGLDPSRFEIAFALNPEPLKALKFLENFPYHLFEIYSISPAEFLKRLDHVQPLFSADSIERYLKDEERVIEAFQPDFIVSDFRLTLCVSARKKKIPFATLTNAYWSPVHSGAAVSPTHFVTRFLGRGFLTEWIFTLGEKAIASKHLAGINGARKREGMGVFRSLRAFYTDADWLLFADLPGLLEGQRMNEVYLGPITAFPFQASHRDLPTADRERPLVYVNLGSSGHAHWLPMIVEALEDLGIRSIIATAGRVEIKPRSSDTFVTAFVSGVEASKRSSLMICNGGSATIYQGVSVGCPVLCIPQNPDQYLSASVAEAQGVSALMLPHEMSKRNLQRMILRMLADPYFKTQCSGVARQIEKFNPQQEFAKFIDRVIGA